MHNLAGNHSHFPERSYHPIFPPIVQSQTPNPSATDQKIKVNQGKFALIPSAITVSVAKIQTHP
jgi:hypothetical protein